MNNAPHTAFLRPSSKWHRHLRGQAAGDTRLWEIAVLFHLRDAFRSGDVWLARSRRYGDLKHALVPAQAAAESGRLTDAWRELLGRVGDEVVVWARTYRKNFGTTPSQIAVPSDEAEEDEDPYGDADDLDENDNA